MSIAFVPVDSTIVRYNEDGSLDTSFGTLGRSASIVGISGALLQTNGQIVAVGPIVSKTLVTSGCCDSLTFETAFAVARYDSDGGMRWEISCNPARPVMAVHTPAWSWPAISHNRCSSPK